VANYLARNQFEEIDDNHPDVISALDSVRARIDKLMNVPKPKYSPDYFHQKLGRVLWEACGMARKKEDLESAIAEIRKLKSEFWQNIKVTGLEKDFNQTLEKAGRVADFIELGHLMCHDAIEREESCGAHARLEYLSGNGEAKRDDESYSHVSAWEYSEENEPILHKEHLHFEFIKPSVRDYK
jgi:succinate dehydrogenase / fumarate reductase flavoprotein subunit